MSTFSGKQYTRLIRETVSAFYDARNESFMNRPDKTRIGNYLTDESLDTMRMFVQLIVTTKFIADDNVKYFLTHISKNYREAAADRKMTEAYLRKRVFYYCSASDNHPGKIAQKLGADLFEVMHNPESDKFTQVRTLINNELIKYSGKDNLQDEIILPIPHYKDTVQLSDSEFSEFVSKIKPYIKKVMEDTKHNLTRRECSYFWHLINNQYCLEGEDDNRYAILYSLCNFAG